MALIASTFARLPLRMVGLRLLDLPIAIIYALGMTIRTTHPGKPAPQGVGRIGSMQRSNGAVAFLGFGAAVAAAGWMGARYSPRDLRTRLWYRRLNKPSFNPPKYVFPIVWTFLYSLIAISGWRVWQHRDSPERTAALRLWISQLLTNAEWTKLFFGKHLPTLSLANIVSLQAAVIGYILEARKVDKAAAALFAPYAAWIAFAAVLNEEIVRRNPNAAKMFPRPA